MFCFAMAFDCCLIKDYLLTYLVLCVGAMVGGAIGLLLLLLVTPLAILFHIRYVQLHA